MSRLFASSGQSIGALVLASVLPMNIQGWFPLVLTDLISLQTPMGSMKGKSSCDYMAFEYTNELIIFKIKFLF